MSTPPCPLPYAVTIHGDRPATVTPCDRWAGHGGACEPVWYVRVGLHTFVHPITPEPTGTCLRHPDTEEWHNLPLGATEPLPEPCTLPHTERGYGYWYDRINATPCAAPSEERAINEQRTLIGLPPMVDADSKWFRQTGVAPTASEWAAEQAAARIALREHFADPDAGVITHIHGHVAPPERATLYGMPVETDTSVPVDHIEIREDGAVLATVRLADATAATFLAYDPARPTFGGPRTIATPEAVADAMRRYADLHGIEMLADDEWKARRDAANEEAAAEEVPEPPRIVARDEPITTADLARGFRFVANATSGPDGSLVWDDITHPADAEPLSDDWQTVGWTSPDSFSFTFETEHLNADLLRAVYGNAPRTLTVTRPRETLADRAINMLHSRRPRGYTPQDWELAPIPSWRGHGTSPSVSAVWKIVDQILDQLPVSADYLRAAATAALHDRPTPPRNIATIAEHMNFTRDDVAHTSDARLADLLRNAIATSDWKPRTATREETIAAIRKAATEPTTYQPFIDVIHPAEWERRQRAAAANVVKGLAR